MMEHTCSYYCERPECIRAQRDELRNRLEKVDQGGAVSIPANCTSDERGIRTVGPHNGLLEKMPNPTGVDLADPLFNAIWNECKSWDVNAPKYYVGYCGLNGSHVMLIVNAIRAAGLYTRPQDSALAGRLLKELQNCEDCESISSRLSDYVREAAAALGGGK